MGKKPDDIEREIARTREELSFRIEALQSRLRSDLGSAVSVIRDEAGSVVEKANESLHLEERMQRSPVTMLAGSLGLGVLLGYAAPGASKNGSDMRARQADAAAGGSGGSTGLGLDHLLATATAPVFAVVQDEVRQFLRGAFYGSRQAGPDLQHGDDDTVPMEATPGSREQ